MWTKTTGNDHEVMITNNYLRDCLYTDNQLNMRENRQTRNTAC